jgi:hypothetical protein
MNLGEGGCDENEKLAVKRMQMNVIFHYNLNRVTFATGALLVCATTALNPKRSMPYRIMPTIILCPLVAGFMHTFGNYGIHRNIDKILCDL